VRREVFGPKREEVAGDWRRLHNEELHNLYPSPSTIRGIESWRMRWAGNVARMRNMRSGYKILAEKPDGESPLERPIRSICEYNIKMGLGEIG